jgi:carbonic anhydrase
MIETSNELLEARECEALVITCMDFRFHAATTAFVRDELNVPTFDLCTIPGAAKGIAEENRYVLNVPALAKVLHKVGSIILVNHARCGAYDISDPKQELEVQSRDLRNAKIILQNTFPDTPVRLFFAQIGDNEVTYIPV